MNRNEETEERPLPRVLIAAIALIFSFAHHNVAAQPTNDQNPEGEVSLYQFSQGKVASAGDECSLTLLNHEQQTGNWCWAGSTMTAMEFIAKWKHSPKDECQLVDAVFQSRIAGRVDSQGNPLTCCNAVRGSNANDPDVIDARALCDEPAWPEDVFGNPNYNFLYDIVLYPPDGEGLPWRDLKAQICQGRPFVFVIAWWSGGRHTLAIGGYRTPPGGENYVEVYDPGDEGFYTLSFNDFSQGIPGEFKHEFDYINLKHF